MITSTRHWARHAWIACLAILFNVFVPVLSHAVNAGASVPAIGMEVCTAAGMEMLPPALPGAPAGNGNDKDKLLKSLSHCGYCAAHAGVLGLPPQPASLAVVVSGHDAFPPLYYAAPRRNSPWSPAQSRAPPIPA